MIVNGAYVRFVRVDDAGNLVRASKESINLLARALVDYAESDCFDVAKLLYTFVSELDRVVDYMGFGKFECERVLDVPLGRYVVTLPNGKVETVDVADFATPTEDMPKPVFERYRRIRNELVGIAEEEVEQLEGGVYLKLAVLERKCRLLMDFLKSEGLTEKFSEFAKKNRIGTKAKT